MKTPFVIISILLAVGLASAISPSINVQDQSIADLHLKVSEAKIFDLGNYFSGFNITFSTNDTSAATVKSAFNVLAGNPLTLGFATDTTQITSDSYPRDVYGNYDYNGLAYYISSDNRLLGGKLANSTASLVGTLSLQVTNRKDTHCYGATQLNSDLVIVDCVSNNTDGSQTNWFYYVSISKGQVVSQTNQTTNVQYTFDPVTGQAFRGVRVIKFRSATYIFRYIGSSAIADPRYKNDSIIEVYTANQDVFNPTVANLINRQTLGADILNLTSFEVVNGSLVILCNCGAVYRIDRYLPNFRKYNINKFNIGASSPILGLTAATELIPNLEQFTFVAWTNDTIFEVDWSFPEGPYVRQTYDLTTDISQVVKVDFTTDFVFAQVKFASTGAYGLAALRRGSVGIEEAHFVVPIVTSSYFWGVDRANNDVHYWNSTYTQNLRFQNPYLYFNRGTSGNGTVLVIGTSIGTNASLTNFTNITFTIINNYDFRIYPNQTGSDINIEYPSSHSINIDELAYGPGLNYSIQSNNQAFNYTFQSYNTFALSIVTIPGKSFNPTQITYNKVVPSVLSPGKFYWLVADGLHLYSFTCTDKVDSVSLQPTPVCQLNGDAIFAGSIVHTLITDAYVATISTDTPSVVNFWNLNLTAFQSANLGDSVNACSDLVLSADSNHIFCPQPYLKQITVWDAVLLTSVKAKVINREFVSSSDAPIFSPQSVDVHRDYPDYLFINNRVGILVLNLGFFWADDSSSMVEVVTNIALDVTLLTSPFDFILNGDSIIIFAFNATSNFNIIEEYRITEDTANPLLIKVYSQFLAGHSYQIGSGQHYSSPITDKFFTLDTQPIASGTKNWLLQFEANTPGNNNFVRPISIDHSGAILLSGVRSSIINADYLIICGSDGSISTFMVYDSDTLTFDAYLSDINAYTEDSTINITVKSLINTTIIDDDYVQFNVHTTNGVHPPTPGNSSTDAKALNLFDTGRVSNNTSVQFNAYDFINGSVADWNLTTEKAEDQNKVLLQLPVSKNVTVLNNYNNINQIVQTENLIYSQEDSSITIYDAESYNATNYVDLTSKYINPSTQKCTHLVVNEDRTYSTSFCYDTINLTSTTAYLVTVSYLGTSPYPTVPFPTNFTKAVSMKIVDDYVFVLEGNGQGTSPNNKLHIYDFSNPANPNEINVIAASTFSANALQCNSFDVLSLGAGVYRVYLVDARFGVRTIELNGTIATNPQSLYILKDSHFVKEYIPFNTLFLGLSIVKNDTNNNTWVVLSTDNYRSYYIVLNSGPNSLNVTVLSTYTKVVGSINNEKIVTYASNDSCYFALSSKNLTSGRGYLNVFNLTGQDNNAQPTTFTDIGRADFQGALYNSRAYLFLANQDATLWAAVAPESTNASNTTNTTIVGLSAPANTTSTIGEYVIRPYFAIKILDSSITSDYMNLTGINGPNSETVQFKITHNGPLPPPGPDGGKGGFPWWGYLLIVLLILVIVGAVVAFIRYRKAQNEEVDDVHAPLTTNYA